MGLIILPILLLAFIILVISIVISLKLLINKKVGVKELALGLLLSILIFGVILACYKILGRAWALSTCFIVPAFLVFFPFGFYFFCWASKIPELEYLSKVVLLSVVFSGILAINFYDFYFDFFDIIGVRRIY